MFLLRQFCWLYSFHTPFDLTRVSCKVVFWPPFLAWNFVIFLGDLFSNLVPFSFIQDNMIIEDCYLKQSNRKPHNAVSSTRTAACQQVFLYSLGTVHLLRGRGGWWDFWTFIKKLHGPPSVNIFFPMPPPIRVIFWGDPPQKRKLNFKSQLCILYS